ncbi:transcription antitermination factor NusB [Desulfogranum mediterraneum]|uniref:transcription antitermination factor NusB n=1 Tax=Desulfogranum mediterraneum TaxID=160661 RepID=UPI0004078BB1|nr:transcription antitermination factor NusB [Desulfogranum mediterraneum]
MGLRRKSRELALQFLFSHDFQERSCDQEPVARELEVFCQTFDAGKKALAYGEELVFGLCEHREAIDALLAEHSHNWRVERMSLVDRNVLRIAVYEMQYRDDVPVQVAINEALEIAKRYSVRESVSFINGILDSVQAGLSTRG